MNSNIYKKIKIIPKILTYKEKIVLSTLAALALASVAFIGMKWINRHSVFLAKNGGTYIEGAVGSPKAINPIFASANEIDNDITHLLFNGLFKNKNDEIVPDIATGLTVSEDKLTYTVKIRTDAIFHDLVPLTADDVVFTVETAQNETIRSSLYGTLHGVKIEKKDDSTVAFTLQQPFAPFPSLLTFGILPKHIWETVPIEAMRFAEANIKTPIGTGPFKIKRFKTNSLGIIKSYTLARNETYFQKPPYLNEIIIKFYPDSQTAIDALKNKNIDGLRSVPSSYQAIVTTKKTELTALSLTQYSAIFFNSEHNKQLSDVRIRKALASSINKTELVETALSGNGVIIDSPILPGFLGFNPSVKKYPYNPEEAEKLIAEAGWKKIKTGEKIAWQKGDDILKVGLTTVDSLETNSVLMFVRKQWEQIGVTVAPVIIPKAELARSVIEPRDYDALLIGNNVGNDPDPYAFWHSSQIEVSGGVNLALYKNPKVDALLEEARKLADRGERARKYVAFQDIIAEDMPAIFLYNPTYSYLQSKKLKGFTTTAITTPADRFNNVEEWYIKTKRKFEVRITK